ncbi:MAG: GAF domain-containing protein [Elusimicrobia bacterium]|nr:GAF domain-containing protein [Elusimicrobiota bacterium]
MAEIIILRAGVEVSRARLSDAPARVGRDSANEIVVDDPRASRNHAVIVFQNGFYVLKDQGSTHGVILGDERVAQRSLRDGDALRIGDWSLVFVERDGAPAPSGGSDQAGTRRLEALFEITVALQTQADFGAVVDGLMLKALNIMGAERGFLMLRSPGSDDLRLFAARDTKGPVSGMDAESVSRSLMQTVLKTGRAVLVENALADAQWQTDSMVHNRIHSALCVPLTSRDEVGGVIYVDHRSRARAFSEKDLEFFSTFALIAKAAMDSNRAYWDLVDGLFQASDDFIAVCGEDGLIARANRGAAALLGIDAAALASRPFDGLFPAQERERAEALRVSIRDSRSVCGVDFTLERPGGARIPLNISGFSLRDSRGRPAGTCLIGRDLSEHAALVRQLTEANARLRELHEMKMELVGGLANEFKDALSLIVGYAGIMRDLKGGSPEDRQRLSIILSAGQKLIALIAEVVDLTRIETGTTGLQVSPVDVREFRLMTGYCGLPSTA